MRLQSSQQSDAKNWSQPLLHSHGGVCGQPGVRIDAAGGTNVVDVLPSVGSGRRGKGGFMYRLYLTAQVYKTII